MMLEREYDSFSYKPFSLCAFSANVAYFIETSSLGNGPSSTVGGDVIWRSHYREGFLHS